MKGFCDLTCITFPFKQKNYKKQTKVELLQFDTQNFVTLF